MKNILKNIGLKIIIVSVSFALAFATGEVFFRLFKRQNIVPRYVKTGDNGIRENISDVRGKMITYDYRHEFSTNSQGFRGKKEYSLNKSSDKYRIIVLGDSVTLGHGVGDDETFSAVLERKLSLVKPTEVINMGVSGYGTAEELIQLREVGLKYSPDLVVLAYFPNDPYNNVVSRLFKLEGNKLVREKKDFVPAIFIRDRLYNVPGYSFLSQHSHVVNFVRNSFSYFFMKKLAKDNGVNTDFGRVTEKEAILTQQLIDEFIDEVRSKSIPLIILNIPLLNEGKFQSNLPLNRLKMSTDAHIVDVQDIIYAGYSSNELSYARDCHPKPLAHKLIGEWLALFTDKLMM